MESQIKEKIILTSMQREVLYGALLGDGTLVTHKHGKNSCFSYTSKSKQHVEYVMSYFDQYITQAGIYDTSYYDKRTNKTYYRSVAKTMVDKTFTREKQHWYPSGKKEIPSDLILTPLTCLIWYIGDGCISHNKRTQNIKLATQCFSKEEQEQILIPQLQDFDASLMKADVSKDGEQQYFIYIPKRKIKKFLEYIGPCPFTDYQYKWNYSEYKNFYLPNQPEVIQEIVALFNNGFSAGTIAKEVGIDRSTVVKYLIQSGLNPKDNLFKRKKVGDLNEE